MDRTMIDAAFREYFGEREVDLARLMRTLAAAGACDETLNYELRLIHERSGALLRIDMLFAIKRRHWSVSGGGRKAMQALLASLAEDGTTDAQLPPSQS
jgi:hypothetical protein